MLDSVSTTREWRRRVQQHIDDARWLSQNEDTLHTVIHTGLCKPPAFHDAVELFMAVFSHYALVLSHTQRWSPLLLEALLQAQDLRDSEMQIRILTCMGESYLSSGKYTAARESFQIALARARDGQLTEMMLAAYTGLIRILSVNVPDNFTTELFDQALVLSGQVKDRGLVAALHQSLAMPYIYARNFVKAIEHGQLAYLYWRHLNNDVEVAKTLYLLAAAYRFAWKLERAEKLLDMAAKTFGATPYDRQYPLVAYEEGALHVQRKNYDLAEQCLKIALQEAIESGSLSLIASAQHALAIAQTGLRQFDAAEANLKQAFVLWEQLGDQYELASAHQAMGDLENKRGNKEAAYHWLQKALELCEKIALEDQRAWLINHIQATIAEIPR